MVIHPQSIVHSLVELADGSVIAQLGVTDMRLPIQYACSYPDRWDGALPSLDLSAGRAAGILTPDSRAFPLSRAGVSGAAGREGRLPVVLNAANEVAVEAFLDGKLGFTAIPVVIERTMNAHAVEERLNLRNRAAGR